MKSEDVINDGENENLSIVTSRSNNNVRFILSIKTWSFRDINKEYKEKKNEHCRNFLLSIEEFKRQEKSQQL